MPPALLKIVENTIKRLEELESVRQSEYGEGYEEEKKALNICITLLPERSRQFIELHFFKGWKIETLAGHFRISSVAVRHAIYRIRDKLGKCIRRTMQSLGRNERQDGRMSMEAGPNDA